MQTDGDWTRGGMVVVVIVSGGTACVSPMPDNTVCGSSIEFRESHAQRMRELVDYARIMCPVPDDKPARKNPTPHGPPIPPLDGQRLRPHPAAMMHRQLRHLQGPTILGGCR